MKVLANSNAQSLAHIFIIRLDISTSSDPLQVAVYHQLMCEFSTLQSSSKSFKVVQSPKSAALTKATRMNSPAIAQVRLYNTCGAKEKFPYTKILFIR